MNRLDWLTNAFPPPYVDTMPLEVWGEDKMLIIKTCWDKALLALCPWRLETSHISILESRRSDERCSWVKHRINYTYVGRYSFSLYGNSVSSAFFRSIPKGNAKASKHGTNEKTQTHTFSLIQTSLTDTRIVTPFNINVEYLLIN